MPKSYGYSGFTPPDPGRKQRRTSTPAEQQTNTRTYLDHMIEADKAYHDQQAARPIPRRDLNAKPAPKKQAGRKMSMRDMQIEKALKDSGA